MKQGLDHIGISVTYFCHDGQGNFIMAKRSQQARDEKGLWDTGGGGLDFGLTVEETLVKEIKEEYSTDVLGYEFLGYRDVHREHEGLKTHWVALDFKVLVDRKKVKIGEPHKFDDLQWFRLDNLPADLHSQLDIFFKAYKEKL
jgi:8-oxo-dGTP pyrophosphatase MutT (NUDIX family)